MTISVSLKNGRLSIFENARLVIDMGGDYIDAVTDGKTIVVLLRNGRVQELRLDGRFVRDILGAGGTGISLSGELLVIKKSDGRIERYKNGRLSSSEGGRPSPAISSSFSKPTSNRSSVATRKGQSEAEKFGAAVGDWVFDALSNALRSTIKNAKEQLKVWRARS